MTNITTADNLEERFDTGEDVPDCFDADSPRKLHDTRKNVSTTLPLWLVRKLDAEAERRGTSRCAVINDWLVYRADVERGKRASAAA